jgi:hypothetical protein
MKVTIEFDEKEDRTALLCAMHSIEVLVTLLNAWQNVGEVANQYDLGEEVDTKLRSICTSLYEMLEILEHE